MDGKAALDLIREVGIYRLCGTDGCLCMHCEVQGVRVDISCRKSNGATERISPDFYGIKLRVHSRHSDADGASLHAIAKEVTRQLEPEGYAIMARFCDWEDDSKSRCTYCHNPRTDIAGYLCDLCLTGKKEGTYVGQTVADEQDFRKYDFVNAAIEREDA